MPDCITGTCEHSGLCYCEDVVPGSDGTYGHGDCWVTMVTNDNYGNLDLVGCDVGCRSCEDYASWWHKHAHVIRFAEKRPWVRPEASKYGLDAQGMQHDLRASVPHLYPASEAVFELGTCHSAEGQHCFGETCRCWYGVYADYVPEPGPVGECKGGVGKGESLPGLHAAGNVFSGRFPLRSPHGQILCRHFYDTAPLRISVQSPRFGGTIHSPNLGQVATIRESLRYDDSMGDTGCVDDWITSHVAKVRESSCASSFSHNYGPGEPLPTYYGAMCGDGSPCANVFQQIRIRRNPTNPPRIRFSSYFNHDRSFRGAWVAAMGTMFKHDFRNPSVRFDRIDHQAQAGGIPPTDQNEKIGWYRRTWDGSDKNILDTDLPVVKTYPYCRTRWGTYRFGAELVIVKADILAHVHIFRAVTSQVGTTATIPGILPYTALRAEITLGLRVPTALNPDGAPIVHGTTADEWPTVLPDGNAILFAEAPGKYVDPPSFVDWQGVLNSYSTPRADLTWMSDMDFTGTSCTNFGVVVEKLGTWSVGGMPYMLDSDAEEPNQLYCGEFMLTYQGTPGYEACV